MLVLVVTVPTLYLNVLFVCFLLFIPKHLYMNMTYLKDEEGLPSNNNNKQQQQQQQQTTTITKFILSIYNT